MKWLCHFSLFCHLPLFGGLLLASLLCNAAAPKKMVFNHVLADDYAKPLGGVNRIEQDSQGFMWFGGESGLGRFDGHQLQMFAADVSNPYKLNSNYIRNLLLDHDDVLWVATEAGICRYVAQVDRFDCRILNIELAEQITENSVQALAVAADNTLYIGGVAGLFRLSPDRQELRKLVLPTSAVGAGVDVSIIDLTLDEQGIVWVGTTDSGLLRYDPHTEQAQVWPLNMNGEQQDASNKIKTVMVDDTNRLWVGTYGAGILMVDATRTKLIDYRTEQKRGLSSNVIWDIAQDSRGQIWFAVDQGGLVRLNEQRQRFEAQRASMADNFSITSDQVRTVFEDKNGDLWLGLFPYGVNFFNHTTDEIQNFRQEPGNSKSLSHNSILSIHQTPKGEIWMGTEDGLNLFQPEQGQFQRIQQHSSELPAKAVLSIEQFDEDTLWVGTWSGGLTEFDLNTHTFKRIDTTPSNAAPQNSLFIWDIFRDANGNMWLGTEFNGANYFDRESGEFHYFRSQMNNPNTIVNSFVWSIWQSPNGFMWFATQGGLSRMQDFHSGFSQIPVASSTNLEVRSERILSVYQDSSQRMWIGSQDRGIFVLSQSGQFIRHFGLTEGMPSLTISGFIEDLAGNVWAGTQNGLVKIDPERWLLSVLNSDNGLVGNNFNRNAFLRDETGRLYFGGADGLSIFDPAKLEPERSDFSVYVTDIRVHNRSVSAAGKHSPIKRAATFQPEVELDYRDSMVAFEFSALNYRHASAMVYAYRLDGFDQTWHNIGKRYSATYTNLPPGDYQFRVRASAGRNKWRESQPLQVHVRAAPWRSIWALIAYAVILIGLGVFIAGYFNLRLKSQMYKTLSIMDPLTGLLNRIGVMQQVTVLFASSVTKPLCLVFIDVDHFKSINDQRGHDAGDRILIQVAKVIGDSVRQADIVGRWGGEEFILLCPGVQELAIAGIAEKVRNAMETHVFEKDATPLKVTISLGVAYVKPGEAFDAALKRADEALYQAKKQGRNRVVIAASQ